MEKFDPEYSNRFATYAQWWIHQRLSRIVGTTSRSIRVPVHLSASLSKAKRMRYEFLRANGRFPTDAELAQVVGVTEEKLKLVFDSSRALLSLEVQGDVGRCGEMWGDVARCGDAPCALSLNLPKSP